MFLPLFAFLGIGCWNPAFDVTPAALITGIVTENGVFKPEKLMDAMNAVPSSKPNLKRKADDGKDESIVEK